MEVDWPIAQPVAWSVYELGNCSSNETYGQTKINHIVIVFCDVILGGEFEMNLASYNSTVLGCVVGYVYLGSICKISIFRHFRIIASRPSVSMEQLTYHLADIDEI